MCVVFLLQPHHELMISLVSRSLGLDLSPEEQSPWLRLISSNRPRKARPRVELPTGWKDPKSKFAEI